MKVYRGIDSFKVHRPVVTIGTFDGVHNGHREVVKQLKQIASRQQGEAVIFTFDPHPKQVLAPNNNSAELLSTATEKQMLFEQLGIDHLVIFPFSREFAQLKYDQFISEILIGKMNMHHLVVGYDHKFGHNRQGGFDFLQRCATELKFGISQLKVLKQNETNVSSTQIREALYNGNIAKTNNFLGYSYNITGTVVAGQQIGRTINFPTANIQVNNANKVIPADGVYAAWVTINQQNFMGMLNIGTRPTVNNQLSNKTIEVHIINFNAEIYGQHIKISFVEKIRDEIKFESINGLKLQLQTDQQQTLKILHNHHI